MNLIKRSLISIYRQPIKSGTFFFVVLLLSMLASGAILVQQAIITTDQNLRMRMPSVSTVIQDSNAIYEQTGAFPEHEIISPDIIRQIGEFPQVRDFDYSIDMRWGVTARGMLPWENPNMPFQMGWDYDEELGVNLHIEGTNNPNFLEIRDQFVELVHGRSFSVEDLEVNETMEFYPVLVSTGFSEANNLNIDSTFEVQVVVFPLVTVGDGYAEDRSQPPLAETIFPLQVIGIFEPSVSELPENADIDELFQMDRLLARMQYRIYVPNFVAELMFEARAIGHINQGEIFFQNLFLLHDPMDFNEFALEVENLEGAWRATDFSSGFRDISASMDNMREIARFILIMAVGATLLIIGLVILLLLHNRKYEIGVYLALGEKKNRIVSQLFIEMIPLAVIGITLALFSSYMISNGLSQEMLRQQMLEQQNEISISHDLNPLEFLGYRFELTHEEMLANFEIGLDINSIILFYFGGLGMIFMSIALPILHTININPKDLLTTAQR